MVWVKEGMGVGTGVGMGEGMGEGRKREGRKREGRKGGRGVGIWVKVSELMHIYIHTLSLSLILGRGRVCGVCLRRLLAGYLMDGCNR